MTHRWYWPFHSWKYSSDYVAEDIGHGMRIWSEYRYCTTCGREQSRFIDHCGPLFRWKDEKDSGDREQAQRYVESCVNHRKSTARLALIDKFRDAPLSELKKRLADFEANWK